MFLTKIKGGDTLIMAKKKTPHFDEWKKTIGKAGKGVAKISVLALKGAAPGISEAAEQTSEALKDAKSSLKDAKQEAKRQKDALMKSIGGRDIKTLLDGALNDIKTGNFSMGKMGDEAEDDLGDFDNMMGDMDDMNFDDDDEGSASLSSSVATTKSVAMIGRAVHTGNIAQMEGMKQMTNTLGSVTVKTSKAASAEIRNAVLLNMNQTTHALAGIAGRLDMINQNIVSMINFQNETTLKAQQGSLDFMSETSEVIKNMSKNIAQLNDAMEKMSHTEFKKKDDDLYGSAGFSVEGYIEQVKKNIKNSDLGSLGTMLSMGKGGLEMMTSLGMSPMEMFGSDLAAMLLPKNIKKSVARFDKIAMKSVDELLYRLGSSDSIFANILGKQRTDLSGSINLANFKKGAMSWNGIAQKTLVEVIPNYLAKIESALTSRDERYYDMEMGRFRTRSQLMNENRKDIQGKIEYGMYSVRNELNDLVKKGTLSSEDFDKLAEAINKPVVSLATNPSDYSADKMKQMIFSEMKQYLPDNDLRDIMMSLNEAISSTASTLQEYTKSMSSGAATQAMRNLYNDSDARSVLSYTDLNKIKLFDRDAIFTDDGKKLSDMTEKERAEYEKQQKMAKKMDSVGKRIKNFFKRDTSDKKTGVTGFVSRNIDNAGNWIHDKAFAYNPKEDVDDIDRMMYGKMDLNEPFKAKSTIYSNIASDQVDPKKVIILPESIHSKTSSAMPATSRASKEEDKEDRQSWITEALDKIELNNGWVSKATNEASSRATNEKSKEKSKLSKDIDSVLGNASKEKMTSISKKTADQMESDAKKIDKIIKDEEKLDSEEMTSDDVMKTYVADMHHNLLKPMAGFFGENGKLARFFSDKHIQDLKNKLFNKEDGTFKDVTLAAEDKKNEIRHAITGKGYTDSEGNKVEAEKESVLDHVVDGYNTLFSNTMKYIHKTDDEKEIENSESYKKFFHLFDWRKNRDKKWEKKEKEKNDKNNVTKITSKIKNETDDTTEKVSKASDEAADIIKDSAQNMSNVVFGDFSNPETEENLKKEANEQMQSQMKKKSRNKLLAAGVGGAAFGLLTATGGTGLLGQFFLPGGPIGGAVLGIGTALLARNEKFQEFMFGEKDENGERTGGVISSSMQKFVKKNMPLIAGGATLGLLKNIIFGSSGGIFGALLGGPVGAAAMSMGIALLKNNERFNTILFGEKSDKDKDNKKFSGRIASAFSKSTKFLKGGAKGAAIGAGTGLVVSKMGLLGAALGPAGIVGGALTGLGLGIASQGDKFKELMFGTEEFDEEGNSKGRQKNGLFHKLQNMLSLRVFEPIHDTLQEETTKFAFWLKDNIKYPFLQAFSPIIDSLKGIKKNITDIVHDAFNNLAETIGNAIKGSLKWVFSPLTKFMGLAGKGFAATLRKGTELALAPLSGGLRLLSMATFKKRMKGKMKEGATIATHLGDIIEGVADKWKNEDKDKFGKGIGGRVNRFLTHGRDLKRGVGAAMDSYEEELKEYGYNTGGWMGIGREKKKDAKMMKDFKHNSKKWREINKYRKQLAAESGHNGLTNYSDEKLAKIRKNFAKLGLSGEGLMNNEDLSQLLYNREDWKAKFDPSLDKTSKAYTDKNGIKINESPEQKSARDKTRRYQDFVMEKFDKVEKNFAIIAARQSLDKEKRLSSSQLVNVTKHLKEKGITWDDLGIDPADKIDLATIKDKDWNKFMEARFSNDEKGGDKKSFSEMIRSHLENLANKMDTGNVIAANNASIEGGLDSSTVNKMTGEHFSDTQLSGLKKNQKVKSKQARDAKEAEESKEAQSGGTSYQDEEEDKDKEAEVPDLKESKDTVFDSIKDFFKDHFGSSSIKATGAMAIGGAASLLFGKEIYSFAKSAMEVLSPLFKKAVNGIGKWWDKNGQKILNAALNRVKDNMSFLIGKVAELSVSAITTAGKMACNAITQKVAGFKFFKDVDGGSSSKYGETYDSVEEAQKNAKDGQKVHKNADGTATTMGHYTDVDENGNAYNLGSADAAGTVARGVIKSKTSPLFRWLMKKSGKLVFNTAGLMTGIIPGFKILKGGYHLAKGIGSGISNIGKGISKARKAAKAGEAAANAGVKGAAKKGTEAATLEGAEAIAKDAAKEGAEATVETGAKKATKEGTEAVIKKSAKDKTKSNVINLQEYAAKKAKKQSEETIKDAAEDKVKSNAEKALKKGAGKAAEATAENAATRKGIRKLLDKAKNALINASETVSKYIPSTKFKKWALKFITSIGEKLASCNAKILKSIGEKILVKTGKAAERTAADATVIIGLGLSIYDAINGFISASYLFGVKSSDVTIGMRTVSSIMEVLLGTAVGAWVDIILMIYGMLTGTNPKQAMARSLYKFVPGGGDEIDDAVSRMELETQKYNKLNGTDLTTDAYNEKINGHRTIGGRIKQGAAWLASRFSKEKREKYDKKYNYKQYEVSDSDVKAYTKYKKSQGDVSASNETLAKDYLSGNTVNGPGPRMKSKMISFGNTTLSQSDPRWGSMKLGKFPNGQDSTMATGGCGPTAFAMAMNALGKNVSPAQAAQYAKSNGYIQDGGSAPELFENGGKDAGVNTKKLSKNSLKGALRSGNPVLISGKSKGNNGPYTSAGHIVMASGLDSKGNAVVNDPMRGKTSVSIGNLSSGMTHAWSYSNNVGGGSKDISYGTLEDKARFEAQKANYFKNLQQGGGVRDEKLVSSTQKNIQNNTRKHKYDKITRGTYDEPPRGVKVHIGYPGDKAGSQFEGQKYFYLGSGKSKVKYTQMEVFTKSGRTKTVWICDDKLEDDDRGKNDRSLHPKYNEDTLIYDDKEKDNNPLIPDKKKKKKSTGSDSSSDDASTDSAEADQTNEVDISSLSPITKLLGVAYANMAAIMGKDYEQSKNSFLTSIASLSSSTTASAATTDDSGTDMTTSGSDAGFVTTTSGKGKTTKLPDKVGMPKSYMGWQMITCKTSPQYRLRQAAGMNFDSEGYGKIGDRYTVAVKPAFGNVGDYIDVSLKNGQTIKAVIADIKGSENGSTGMAKYVHSDGSVVEFVVDKSSWYSRRSHGNADSMHTPPGSSNNHPEWHSYVSSISNVGSYKKDTGKSYGIGSTARFTRAIGYGGNWLAIVQAVKSAYADSGTEYHRDNYHDITITVDGKSMSVRPDCSGFVSACLRYYGSLKSNLTSSSFTSLSSLKGFTKARWPGWDKLQAGDIIARNGHVEIYAGEKNGRHMVYNAGSTPAISNPGVTYSSYSAYTTIWRPNEAGNLDGLALSSSGTMNNSGTSDSSTASSDSSTTMSAASTPLDYLFNSASSISSAFNFDKMLGFGIGPSETPKKDSPEAWFTNTLDGEVTSGYGSRNTSLGNEYHKGIDIASSKGKSIKSPISGTVVSKGTDAAGYGNYAVVRDGSGNNHLFAHMNKPVGYGIGDSVNRNDVIGEVGSSGKATGDHLHYEIRKNGNKYSAINPSNYKYDKSVNSNLNISKNNIDNSPAIGSGEKDIHTKDVSDKLNIALNTDNMEDKMDTLIEVMKTWAERDEKRAKTSGFNQVNNTTVNYGNGKQKPVQKTTTRRRTTKEIDDMSLAEIHKMIAAK